MLLAFTRSTIRGNRQVTVAGKGISAEVLNKALMLFLFAIITVVLSTFALTLTEGGMRAHGQTPLQVLDYFFESVSAFATVGLSTGVTPALSDPGKAIISLLMFVGRLGPIWLITTIQQLQKDRLYQLPETDILIG